MDQARIEWLHRLGIDVWRLRKTNESIPVSALKQSKSVAVRAKESASKIEEKIDESKSSVFTALPPTERSMFVSKESENQPDHSTNEVIGAEQPSFKLQCLFVGTCLVVFNAGDEFSNEMARGIGNALSKYESVSHQSLDFVWPPASNMDLPRESSHVGWESARRAFNSLIGRQDWTTNILVAVGSDANQVTERIRNTEYTVLKLDEFPASAQSKKELWQRIQEIL
ncbi:MAG: hypothetical protein F4X44_05965 [Gammaproteobacteria bacterium]|nr:hypothetical protein [Gammaproteobacteria bacterium]MYD80138.1 hypothetical protein [Gammaproteobacteria bacterium]